MACPSKELEARLNLFIEQLHLELEALLGKEVKFVTKINVNLGVEKQNSDKITESLKFLNELLDTIPGQVK